MSELLSGKQFVALGLSAVDDQIINLSLLHHVPYIALMQHVATAKPTPAQVTRKPLSSQSRHQ